jgi:hypothetical protein
MFTSTLLPKLSPRSKIAAWSGKAKLPGMPWAAAWKMYFIDATFSPERLVAPMNTLPSKVTKKKLSMPAGAGDFLSCSSSATICLLAPSKAAGGMEAFIPASCCSIMGTIIVSRVLIQSAWSCSSFRFFPDSTAAESPSSGPTSHHGRSVFSTCSPMLRNSSML